MSDKPSYWGKIFSITESPNTLRRKLQDVWRKLGPFYDQVQRNTAELDLIIAFAVNLPKFGGIWREQQATPFTFAMTTGWQPLLGYTTVRPETGRGVEVDVATGKVTVNDAGVYLVEAAIAYTTTTKNRYVEWGVSINGADPIAFVPQEVFSTKGATILSLTVLETIPTAPVDLYLMCRGEIADDLLFSAGGWSLERESYLV